MHMRRTRITTPVLRSDPTGKLVWLGIPMTLFGQGECPCFLGDGVIHPHNNVRRFTTLQIVTCRKTSVGESWDITYRVPIWHKVIYMWLCSGWRTFQVIVSRALKTQKSIRHVTETAGTWVPCFLDGQTYHTLRQVPLPSKELCWKK